MLQPRQSHPELDPAYPLVQQFAKMLHTRICGPFASTARKEKEPALAGWLAISPFVWNDGV